MLVQCHMSIVIGFLWNMIKISTHNYASMLWITNPRRDKAVHSPIKAHPTFSVESELLKVHYSGELSAIRHDRDLALAIAGWEFTSNRSSFHRQELRHQALVCELSVIHMPVIAQSSQTRAWCLIFDVSVIGNCREFTAFMSHFGCLTNKSFEIPFAMSQQFLIAESWG